MEIEYSSRGFLTTLFRQGKPSFVISLVIFLTGLAYLIITKSVYESSGNLVVKFAQSTQEGSAPGADQNARQEIINSYIKILSGRHFLEERIKAFGVYRLYPELADEDSLEITPEALAIKNLLDNDLRITSNQSRMIDVSVRNHDPEVAAAFAAEILKAFIEKRTEIYSLPQGDLLQKQADDARLALEAARNNFQEFKQTMGISDPDVESSQLLREKSELSTLTYTAAMQEQSKLADLEVQAAKMGTTYRPESTMLAGLQSTIKAARANLRLYERNLHSEDKQPDGSHSTLMTINKRLAYLELHRGAYNQLQQQVKIRDENYTDLQKKSEDARISILLNSKNATHIGIVDNPAVPFEPIQPQKKIFFAITLLAALISGFGTILSRELFDDRLINPEQVLTHIGVPVLAVYRNEITYDPRNEITYDPK
jgi:uncharacterized protein involved in exopolysaccharide biosynthesis